MATSSTRESDISEMSSSSSTRPGWDLRNSPSCTALGGIGEEKPEKSMESKEGGGVAAVKWIEGGAGVLVRGRCVDELKVSYVLSGAGEVGRR